MKKKIEQEEEFFSQVEEVLHTHEDTYEVGAWEDFVATKRKNHQRRPLFAWIAAAAVLLLLGFGLFEITTDKLVEQQTASIKNNTKPPHHPGSAADSASLPFNEPVTVEEQAVWAEAKNEHTDYTKENIIKLVTAATVLPLANVEPSKRADYSPIAKDTVPKAPLFTKERKYAPVVAGAYDSLMNQNRIAKADEHDAKKLTYSLVVSPSISNQKVNFGAGMELSYKLGQHLSLSSGVMYTAIGAKSDGNSLVSTSNAMAQDANLALRGIEIPLGIQYQTKNGFYASAGVSALGLIKDKLEYSYLAEGMAADVKYSPGLANEVLQVVNEKQTQKSIEPLNNYMGFFNFSAGKKQAIGNINFNIGPFVKVPFSSVSSEKIKLLQGGIKVSVDF
jgi:cytoskeletal protein RodZ